MKVFLQYEEDGPLIEANRLTFVLNRKSISAPVTVWKKGNGKPGEIRFDLGDLNLLEWLAGQIAPLLVGNSTSESGS